MTIYHQNPPPPPRQVSLFGTDQPMMPPVIPVTTKPEMPQVSMPKSKIPAPSVPSVNNATKSTAKRPQGARAIHAPVVIPTAAPVVAQPVVLSPAPIVSAVPVVLVQPPVVAVLSERDQALLVKQQKLAERESTLVAERALLVGNALALDIYDVLEDLALAADFATPAVEVARDTGLAGHIIRWNGHDYIPGGKRPVAAGKIWDVTYKGFLVALKRANQHHPRAKDPVWKLLVAETGAPLTLASLD